VLVDNASIDGSIEFVKDRFGKKNSLRIIRNYENLGFAGGSNAGIKLADGKYLVFLNNDTEVDKNWLWELVKVMESDRSIGAAQCKLISMCDKKRFYSAGGLIDCFAFSADRGGEQEDVGQYDKIEEIFFAHGAAFVVRHDVLNEVGCFDNDYFLFYEETDLCWRIWLRGYRIVFVPRSVVFHVGSATIDKRTRAKLKAAYHRHKNQITTLLKNYQLSNLLWYVPILVFLKVVPDIAYLRTDQFVRIKGILYNMRNLNQIWRKRIMVQKYVRKEKDATIFKRNLVVPFSLRHAVISLSTDRAQAS
jgi:GT2 family glycosyltransferase